MVLGRILRRTAKMFLVDRLYRRPCVSHSHPCLFPFHSIRLQTVTDVVGLL